MCADGATFSQIKNLVKKPTNWEKSFKQFNILNFTKTFPLCLFYNDKFYHVENFKDKIARNSPYC